MRRMIVVHVPVFCRKHELLGWLLFLLGKSAECSQEACDREQTRNRDSHKRNVSDRPPRSSRIIVWSPFARGTIFAAVPTTSRLRSPANFCRYLTVRAGRS